MKRVTRAVSPENLRVVRQPVAGKDFLFNDRGDHALKGFEYPVRVYGVRWRESEAP